MKMKNGEQKDIGCNGKGRRTILVKVKKFREPAKMFVQCRCAKCQRHLTQLAPDAGDSAASSGSVQASAESTSQTDPAPTQRG